MNATEIHALLTEALQHTIDNGDRGYFAEGTFPPDGWIQVTYSAINLSYAPTRDPAELIAQLDVPEYVEVASWEANTYLTLNHGADDLEAISKFTAELIAAIAAIDS